jgi:2-polyprenyl-3-methyl-5-hydroxy-6-metoxy-1,4-benzoquinol methylase
MIIKNFKQADLPDSEFFRYYEWCPICNSTKFNYLLTSHDNHYGVQGEFDHFACSDCTALFLNPMPTEKFLSNAYPSDYYAYQRLKGNLRLRNLVKKIIFVNSNTKDPKFKTSGKILDIGCGSGEFLLGMKKKGWSTYGVEPSKSAAALGNQYDLNIHNGTLLTSNYSDAFFDYIRSNHSLEHIPNPHENLKEIARIIKPGGKLFIGVPNTDGFAFSFFKQFWWNLTAPQHPINYNSRSLQALVLPYGFKRVSECTNSSYAGLLGSYQIKVNNKRGQRSAGGMLLNFIPFQMIGGFMSKILDLFKKGDCLEMIFEKT